MYDQKKLKISIGIGLIILLLLPLSINAFLIWSEPFSRGEDNSWIIFFGSYLGGIIGGIISGSIILIALLNALKKNDQDRFLESYFRKKLVLDEVITTLKGRLNRIRYMSDTPRQIEELIENKEFLRVIVNKVKADVGGSIAIELHRLYNIYSNIELDQKILVMTQNDTEIAEKYYGFAISMLFMLQNYRNSLEEKYRSTTGASPEP